MTMYQILKFTWCTSASELPENPEMDIHVIGMFKYIIYTSDALSQKGYKLYKVKSIFLRCKSSVKSGLRSNTYRFPLLFCSCNKVAIILAPVQPRGCPKAIAPPFGLIFSAGIPNSSEQYVAWLANASLISNISISSRVKPEITTKMYPEPISFRFSGKYQNFTKLERGIS